PKLRENFIESVFAYDRWRKLRRRPSIGKLVEFHARHKMQLLAHSEKHMRQLGKLVAAAKSMTPAQACDEYGQLFMEAMRIQSTVRKNVNVLQHIAGFFKTQLEPSEREELHQAIGDYHQGLVPLIAPLTLLRYFVRRFAVDYLAPQTYLSPHPKELMLRNHV
ncbi:MAG TPA: YbgA family protein, partial [candidate division Zixibacteria bacterium]|nr:YbgA family protein [candidate division Zixibacteria bacterium]